MAHYRISLHAHTLRRRPRPSVARRLADVDEGLAAFERVLVTLTASMTTFCGLFRRYLLWRERGR